MILQGHAEGGLAGAMSDTHYLNLFAFRTIVENEIFDELGRRLFLGIARTLADHDLFVRSVASPDLEKSVNSKLSNHIASVEKQASGLKNGGYHYRNWSETSGIAATFA